LNFFQKEGPGKPDATNSSPFAFFLFQFLLIKIAACARITLGIAKANILSLEGKPKSLFGWLLVLLLAIGRSSV